jgi:aerobic-type carbon monoxide dehydrogenase small subunit (CoxS/CutS family)
MIKLNINGESRSVDVPPDMAPLWVLRAGEEREQTVDVRCAVVEV